MGTAPRVPLVLAELLRLATELLVPPDLELRQPLADLLSERLRNRTLRRVHRTCGEDVAVIRDAGRHELAGECVDDALGADLVDPRLQVNHIAGDTILVGVHVGDHAERRVPHAGLAGELRLEEGRHAHRLGAPRTDPSLQLGTEVRPGDERERLRARLPDVLVGIARVVFLVDLADRVHQAVAQFAAARIRHGRVRHEAVLTKEGQDHALVAVVVRDVEHVAGPAVAQTTKRGHREHTRNAAHLQRLDVGSVRHPVGRVDVSRTVARDEVDLGLADLADRDLHVDLERVRTALTAEPPVGVGDPILHPQVPTWKQERPFVHHLDAIHLLEPRACDDTELLQLVSHGSSVPIVGGFMAQTLYQPT